jgi:phosphatidylglycerophosphatase A
MARVKETSDSLSHPVVETPHIRVAPEKRRLSDYLALAVATCGVGFIPVAPGTWGSAVGVGVYLLGRSYVQQAAAGTSVAAALALTATATTLLLALIVVVSLAGAWAATRVEALLKRKDPGIVVVDEVAGQLITFLFVPWDASPLIILVGFVAFRVFDIWKPYPVNRLEGLETGLGVMADDVLAGAYAATLMAILTSLQMIL